MRLRHIQLKNFRGFDERSVDFHPSFNLLIGENGFGKTSVLEGIAVAIGAWLQAFPRTDQRHIRSQDIRQVNQMIQGRTRMQGQYPVIVEAVADVELDGFGNHQIIQWSRSIERFGGRTTNAGSANLRKIAREVMYAIGGGSNVTLPVLRYFGAGRLWESVRNSETKRASQRSTLHMAEVPVRAEERATSITRSMVTV
ncbi:ATP-binding protein [Komagataeibacter rhaeticus]|nr:ATP-binding protein [Komagataeibacter rhaeticus]